MKLDCRSLYDCLLFRWWDCFITRFNGTLSFDYLYVAGIAIILGLLLIYMLLVDCWFVVCESYLLERLALMLLTCLIMLGDYLLVYVICGFIVDCGLSVEVIHY